MKIKTDVVDSEIPLLLSRNEMKNPGAKIDLRMTELKYLERLL